MPPPRLFDLADYDLEKVELTKDQIYTHIPHQYEFQLLDGVCLFDREAMEIVAYTDIRADDWWVRAHVEGRPLLPGVLMLEMAAQTMAVAAHQPPKAPR